MEFGDGVVRDGLVGVRGRFAVSLGAILVTQWQADIILLSFSTEIQLFRTLTFAHLNRQYANRMIVYSI